MKGLSAGRGLAFDDSLTLSIATGAANITTVDGASERMTVTSDGKTVFSFPVSLGDASTPTYGGTKIVMEKDRVQEMKNNPGEPFYDLQVPWSVRLTNSGEFVHSASWNGGNIGVRSTSHGCTNLNVAAAKQYFEFAQIGDVFTYTNTDGPIMPSWDGYGDWNVPWPTWQSGGVLA
ncbi:MAG: L,D-transpeptidase [Pseudonocardiales bacterium]